MTFFRVVIGFVFAITLTACAMGSPALPLPTATSTAIVPTATVITIIPTATATPLPPTPTATATATSTPTATPTFTPTATPTLKPTATATLPAFLVTQDTPQLPDGKGGLIINNYFGVELSYDIGNTFYKVPPYSRMIIFLPPGRYAFSASAVGFSGKAGSTEVLDGYYRSQDWR